MSFFDDPLMPFRFPFMVDAFLIVAMIAVPAALLSCFLVLKGWSLMGDAVAHAVLPGVVIAYIVGIPFIVGAFFAGMFCALATGFLQENSRVKRDTIMGVVFSGMFGFGIVLYTKIESDVHLDHILFGNMLGVGRADLITTGVIAAIVVVAIALRWRDLMLHSFDEVQAKVAGLPVRAIHYALLIILSLTIVSALKAVGIILTIALLIAPGAIAFLLTKRFETMMMVAAAASLFSTFAGVYASFFIDSAPAPTIVLVMTALFIAAFVYSTRKAARLSASAELR
ncbi:metal ABC transporter permease [Pseudahrensia aquimaris]|uniref:Metal ABC transporter permease n=1 Tax=Pseudahrensia aquimaris TaxID=744461 RepID=A0ABW3FHB5_9HYPH